MIPADERKPGRAGPELFGPRKTVLTKINPSVRAEVFLPFSVRRRPQESCPDKQNAKKQHHCPIAESGASGRFLIPVGFSRKSHRPNTMDFPTKSELVKCDWD